MECERMNEIKITLPLPSAKLHAHATGHWRAKAGPTKELRELACVVTRQEISGKKLNWQRATLEYQFFFKTNRRRDAANCVQSMKPAVDGVVDAGLLIDDCWQVLEIAGVRCSVDKANPRTELIFRRVG